MTGPGAGGSLAYPDQSFHSFLEEAARAWPERTALLFEEDRYTYAELDSLTDALANGLAEHGLRAGTRVGLCMSNRPEWILTFFALSKIGASAVLMSPAWRQAELRHALALTTPSAVIADGESRALLEEAGPPGCALTPDDGVAGWTPFSSLLAGSSDTRDNGLAGELRTLELALPFSSGTTGLPKAVRHSHRTLVTSTLQWAAVLGMGDTDVIQAYTPLGHILGILNIAAGIASGASVRLFRRFVLGDVLRSIEQDRVTIGIAVAPIALAMADLPELETYDLSSLRYFNWCATPVNDVVADRFTARTGVRWMQAYGATESPVLFCNPVEQPEGWRLDSPGIAVPDVEADVVDIATGNRLPAGETGEIVVRSPGTMLGYLPVEADADAFLPGRWYRTGDLGWLEPEGWLHITGRLKEMIKVSAFQVTPAEVEAVLLEHPDVADCAVFGVPDEAKGQVPHVVVVPRGSGPLDPEQVRSWLRARLASYKQPAAVHVVAQVPRTASGKTLRRQLTAQYGGTST